MKKLCSALVCVACLSAFADIPPEPDSEWEAGSGITGVGEITQTMPGPAVPNRRNLHYDSPNGDPEQAIFVVDTSEATDIDKKKYYYLTGDECTGYQWDYFWMYADAGVGVPAETNNWICSPAAGELTQGSFASTFTPGTGIYSGITIQCYVYEGLQYSYADGNYDSEVSRTWSGTLNTFKVTMYSQPGNKVYAEDDPLATRLLGGLSNGALDLGTIGWTGILAQPGATPTPARSGQVSRSITWTTRCETDTGVVGGIMGSVSFTPYINCDGLFHAASTPAGLLPPGSVGNVAAGFAAAYNPYVGAAVLFTNWAMGSKPHTNYGIIGESVIEYGTGILPRIDFKGSVTSMSSTSVDLANLSISKSQSASVPVYTANGSIDIKSQLQCYDNSISSEITAFLKVRMDSPVGVGTTTWGSTRPSYSN